MSRYVVEALGTLWYIRVYEEKFEFELQAEITACILEFQKNYTRFSPTSLLSKLNREGRLENPPEELFEMCLFGEQLRTISAGAFNPSVCYVLVKEGYGQDYREHDLHLSVRQLKQPYMRLQKDLIELQEGVSIDLGAIGKGKLVDKVAKLLKSKGKEYFMINAGGDIYATTNHNKHITCVLENPFKTDEFIGTISLEEKAIACSSQNRRYWNSVVSGKKFSHLIDTKTFRPKQGVAGVFTEASSTTVADAVSTALFVSEPQYYEQIAAETGTEFAIIYKDGAIVRSKGYNGTFNTA